MSEESLPAAPPRVRIKGRGAASNPEGRFETRRGEWFDDGWARDEEPPPHPATVVTEERARSILARNDSPDIGFDRSINPYRGCEHGCIYCYARPSHGYLNLSAGLDFETRLFAKTNAVELLRRTLSQQGYVVEPIAFGTNTDPYQPIERRYRIMRGLLELLHEVRHPLTIVTKGGPRLVEDLELLAALARERLVRVFVSITSLDNALSARLEPRASSPTARLRAVEALASAGVPVGIMVAPVIPMITDRELEAILGAARAAGAGSAAYVMLRLPWEVKELFREWLALHYPERAAHVMSLVRQIRGGRDNDARFGTRMKGEGVFAELVAKRFAVAWKKHGYDALPRVVLDKTKFRAPRAPSPQAELF